MSSGLIDLKSLVLFAALGGLVGHAHVCIHGDPDLQRSYSDVSVASASTYRGFDGQADTSRQSIRIAFDFKNMELTSKYCTSASDTRPFIASGPVSMRQCTTDSVFNPSVMYSVVKDRLMPKAKAVIEGVYNVTRIASQNIVARQCGDAVDVSGPGGSISDVDLLVFVAAGVMPSGYEGTLAYAYPCTQDPNTGRPISAVINFNSKYLSGWVNGYETYDNDELVQTAVHELHHAMGFTRANLEAKSATLTARGKTVYEVQTPNVIAKGKEFFGCNDLTGVEIEDEGGDGSRLAHWDRRIVFEEMMVAAGGAKLSPITLAFMEDLGYYSVNYSQAKRMVVGAGFGCGFVQEKCNVPAGGKDTFWFFDSSYRCSPDHRLITRSSWGPSTTSVPTYYQYDPANPTYASPEGGFTDRCPYGVRVSESECGWDVPNSNGVLFGSYPGVGARCFETSGLRVDSSSTTVSYRSRCFQARCPFGGKRIEFSVGGSKWIACPIDGSAQSGVDSPSGYSGAIECPPAVDLCDKEVSFGSAEREELALGDSLLPEASGFSALTITVVLNGTKWVQILSDERRITVLNRIRQDAAFFLKSSSSSVRIRRITPSEDTVSIIFGIAEPAYTSSIVSNALDKLKGRLGFFPYVEASYASLDSNAAAEAPSIAIVNYIVEEPSSSSICGDGITSTTCVTIISVVVFGVVSIVLLFVIYCVCVRSPFSIKPHPDVARKYGVADSPVDKA